MLHLNEAVEISAVSIIRHCYSVTKCHSYGCEHEVIIKALSKLFTEMRMKSDSGHKNVTQNFAQT